MLIRLRSISLLKVSYTKVLQIESNADNETIVSDSVHDEVLL